VARLEAGGDGMGAAARRAASAAIVMELQQVRAAYNVADAVISVGADMLAQVVQRQREQITAVLGGRDPFEFVRDAGVALTHQLAEKAGQLEQAAALSTSGTERAQALRAGCDSVLGFIDSLQIPDVDIPGASLLLDPLRSAIDEGKALGREPVQALRGHADQIAEFLGIFADIARQQVAAAREQIQDISQGLAKCNGFEDVMNLMLRKIQEGLGLGTNLTIQDVRDAWNGLGGQIDAATAWAQSLGEEQPAEPPDLSGGATMPAEPPAAGQAAAAAAGTSAGAKPMAAPATPGAAAAGAGAGAGNGAADAATAAGPGAGAAAVAGAGAAAVGGAHDGDGAAGAGAGAAGGAHDGAGAAGAGAAANGAEAAAGGQTIEERLAAAAAARA